MLGVLRVRKLNSALTLFMLGVLRVRKLNSALTLFMLWVFAYDHHAAFALDDLAFLTHRFNGRTYFHDVFLSTL